MFVHLEMDEVKGGRRFEEITEWGVEQSWQSLSLYLHSSPPPLASPSHPQSSRLMGPVRKPWGRLLRKRGDEGRGVEGGSMPGIPDYPLLSLSPPIPPSSSLPK